MSKRAEERGLEALPPRWRKTKDGKGKVDSAQPVRKFYIRAYERAEKDTIERAIAWLKEHANNYIVNITESYPDAPFQAKIGGKCWEDLIKAMEDEQMTYTEAIDILRKHNEWRRYYGPIDKGPEMTDPTVLGEAIDTVVNAGLTWLDIQTIIAIYEQGVESGEYRRYNEAEWMKLYSQDILRRFNKTKEEEQ